MIIQRCSLLSDPSERNKSTKHLNLSQHSSYNKWESQLYSCFYQKAFLHHPPLETQKQHFRKLFSAGFVFFPDAGYPLCISWPLHPLPFEGRQENQVLAYKETFMLAQNFPSLQQFPLLMLLQRSNTSQTIHTGLSNLKKTLMSSVVFCLQNRVFWQSLHGREIL